MRRFSLVAVVSAAVLLGGCATYQTGSEFDESRISDIEQGETTKTEIEQWFGTPTGTGTEYIDGVNVERYTYSHSEGGATPITYVPFIGGLLGGTEGESKTLHVYFNKEDVVKRHHFSESTQSTSTL